MTTILFLWTVVAAGSGGIYADWRSISEFTSPTACISAIKELGIDEKNARCIPKNKDKDSK